MCFLAPEKKLSGGLAAFAFLAAPPLGEVPAPVLRLITYSCDCLKVFFVYNGPP